MPGTVHPRERLEVLCIGGANVDGDFRLAAAAIAGTSNPATARTSFGGVARNVAEDLARLGRRTGLVSRVGDDAAGRGLLDHAAGLGIDVRHALVAAGATTSQYLAIHDPDGELVIGVNAMALIDGIAASDLAGMPYDETDWVFADTNLSAGALGEIVGRRRSSGAFRLAIDAVAIPKASRLPAALEGIDLLFANAGEAAAILGRAAPSTPEGGAGLARGLLDRGAGAASVSLGRLGAVVADAGGVWHVGVAPTRLASTSGTGDARIAGTLHALLDGASLEQAAVSGSLAAALTAESDSAIDAGLGPTRFAAESARLEAVTVRRIEA